MRDLPGEAGGSSGGESDHYKGSPRFVPWFNEPLHLHTSRALVEELRQKGVDKSRTLCRKPLPPLNLGVGIYMKIKGAIDQSRPGVAQTNPWPALSKKQQGEMDQAAAMPSEAADQGHTAQACCGELHNYGWGVAKNDRLAIVYYEKAANKVIFTHSTTQ